MNIPVRPVLALDAAGCLVGGVVLAAAAGALAEMMALPEGLLRGAGLVLVPWALFVGWLATWPQPGRRAVAWVAALNALWTVDSVLLLVFGWVAPNALGTGFVLAQAAVGGGFAAFQAASLTVPAVQRA